MNERSIRPTSPRREACVCHGTRGTGSPAQRDHLKKGKAAAQLTHKVENVFPVSVAALVRLGGTAKG